MAAPITDASGIVMLALDRIDVGERYRKSARTTRTGEHGTSIKLLAKSIEEVGLLNPVIVMPGEGAKYRLVTGERRMLAVKSLGLQEIEARVVDTFDEAMQLQAELDENVQRLEMTAEEAMCLYEARLALPTEALLEGEEEGANFAPGAEQGESKPKPKKRELAAKGTGQSHETSKSMRGIVDACENLQLPQDIRDQIEALREQVNNKEKAVSAAWRETQKLVRQGEKATATATPEGGAQAEEGSSTAEEGSNVEQPPYYGQRKALDASHKLITQAFEKLGKAFRDAENFDPDVTPEEVEQFVKSLRAGVNMFAASAKSVGA